MLGLLVDAHSRFGGTAADMPQDDVDTVGDQFGGRIGGHFRFTDVVFHQKLDWATTDTAHGITLFGNQFRGGAL